MAEKIQSGGNNSPKTIEELEKEVIKLTELLKMAYTMIKEQQEKLKEYEQTPDGYNKKWTWITKIAFVIAQADKPLLLSEISATLSAYEPDLNKMNDREKFFSSVLHTAFGYGRFVRYKLKGVRGSFYCLPEWIDSTGELAQEFKKKVF